MKYSTTTSTLADARTDCLIAGFSQCRRAAGPKGAAIFKAATTDFEDKAGQTLMISFGPSSPVKRMLVVGGLKGTLKESDFAKAMTAAAKALASVKTRSALWAAHDVAVKGRDPYWKTMSSIGALNDAIYAFNHYKTSDVTPPTLKTVAFHADARSRANIARVSQAAGFRFTQERLDRQR